MGDVLTEPVESIIAKIRLVPDEDRTKNPDEEDKGDEKEE